VPSPGILPLVGFTVVMALAGVAAIFPFGVLLGYWLARTRWRGRIVIETIASLPLVLPPTVVGLLLLELLARQSPLGGWLWRVFGLEIAFTWRAVAISGAVMGFPLLVRTVHASFEQVDRRLEAIAQTLGRGPAYVFLTVSLPLASRGILAGSILAFSRALGEFGATILVAGNIPGETQTLALAIFQLVQTGRDTEALRLAVITVILAFVAIGVAERLTRAGSRGGS
jgi:molybdate transport system permease protein